MCGNPAKNKKKVIKTPKAHLRTMNRKEALDIAEKSVQSYQSVG